MTTKKKRAKRRTRNGAKPLKLDRLTLESLKNIPDRHLEYSLIQFVDRLTLSSDFLQLAKGLRMLYAACWVDFEVTHSGFLQYFGNPYAHYSDEAVRGFKAIGAKRHAEVLKRAIHIFKKRRPLLRLLRARWDGKANELSPFKKLDKKYKSLTTNLGKRWVRYVRNHPGEFVEPVTDAT